MTEDSSPTSSPRRDRQRNTSSASHTKLVIVIVFICSLASIYYSSINLAGCNDKQKAAVARQEDALPTIQENTNATTITTTDPEAVDCSELLRKFRADEIEVAKKKDGSDVHFRRSFVTLAQDPEDIGLKPFYISTHDKELDNVRASIMKYNFYYERELTGIIRGVFTKKQRAGGESIFLDVGANIGWFSLVAAAHGATKVYSFEPNLQNTIRFCESLTLNGWDSGDLVMPIAKGVGRVEERKKLYGDPRVQNPGSYSFNENLLDKSLPVEKILVGEMEITTLDAFAERHNWFETKPSIAFFKLDVEYFELQVLQGAKKLLNSRMVEMIAMELKHEQPKEEKHQILEILLDAGFEFWMYGAWMGPNKEVKTKYTNATKLVEDFEAKMFDVNVLFRLRDQN
jgi:FkbM family methyltransferase